MISQWIGQENTIADLRWNGITWQDMLMCPCWVMFPKPLNDFNMSNQKESNMHHIAGINLFMEEKYST